MMRLLLAACGAALLAGCANEAADLGHTPPVRLESVQRQVVVPLRSGKRTAASARVGLRRAVDALAGGDLQAVRARIEAGSVIDAEAVRRELVGLGLDPARITAGHDASLTRLPPIVTLGRTIERTADCKTAIGPALGGDPSPSLLAVARCNQANNLAAMLVDPADLFAPPPLARTDGAYLVDGVQSWRTSRNVLLPAASTSDNLSGAGANGGNAGTPANFGSGTGPLVAAPLAAQAAPVAR